MSNGSIISRHLNSVSYTHLDVYKRQVINYKDDSDDYV